VIKLGEIVSAWRLCFIQSLSSGINCFSTTSDASDVSTIFCSCLPQRTEYQRCIIKVKKLVPHFLFR
jgi:hypothetical protein